MPKNLLAKVLCVVVIGAVAVLAFGDDEGPQQPWSKWKVADAARPMAPEITPGTPSTQAQPGKPPSDAIVLFDGTNGDNWLAADGSPNPWKVQDGVMTVNTTDIRTKQEFGDIQLHVEWSEPPAKGNSQKRGNSGVFLMSQFEIQVLDNFKNPTYADGQCAAIYTQYPPQVNVCLPPGTWQTYDIIFHHPRFTDGKLVDPAYVTVLQNGVLVQDHQRIEGPTRHLQVSTYTKPIEKGPIRLQCHENNPVHFRNIWVRPLEALENQQQTGDVPAAAH